MSTDRQPDDESGSEGDQSPDDETGIDLPPIDENGLPDCPLCGQPVSMVRIDGPDEAIVSPCGCQLPPDPFFEPRHT